MKSSGIDGLLVIDKPQGITSRDAVDRVQRWFPRGTRVGHTGTLDPLATGVLVLCLGSATRLAEYVQQMKKVYRTTIHLGAVSDSDDADGAITSRTVERIPERSEIEACLPHFLGEIEQVPPTYSAAKVTGRRAYALARSGQEVQLGTRRVRIETIDVLRFEYPLLELEIRCGKGTYIRSLARDLGERLGCGGYVEVLRRLSVGPFRAEEGVTLDVEAETAHSRLLPIGAAMSDFLRVEVTLEEETKLRHGVAVSMRQEIVDDECALFTTQGELIGIGRVDREKRAIKPMKIIPKPV